MASELYAIAGVVGVVLVVALFGLVTSPSPTIHVISEPCDCVPGQAVCGAVGHHLQTYASSCHAACAGARIVYEDRCAAIPVV